MADVCPDALFLNYTNPMGMLVRGVHEAVGFPTVGLCHSVYWTVDRLANYLGLPAAEVEALSAGVNHLAWIMRLEHRGRDLYPRPARVRRRGPGARRRPRPGRPVPAVRHLPHGVLGAPRRVQPVVHPQGPRSSGSKIPIGEYLKRVANNLDEYADTKRKLDAGEPFEIERSGEYAALIVNAMATGEPTRIVANVMNHVDPHGAGGGSLIANLAADACVEVPALVDALGVHPTAVGSLPPQCAAYTRPAVDCQELTVTAALDEDRDLVYHAVITDPIVQARLSLDEAWRMTDELIAAEAEWLPAWLGGTAPDWHA